MKALAGLVLLLTACTTEQAYYIGQQWQGNQCSQLVDRQDYDVCMRRSGGSYDSYRKERDQFQNTQ